ncbi:MAG: acyl-CoA thioesterase [Myxococcales bacterium]|nr:acyl-CoA thioesterase [Myxococcales bacterium]MCB9749289.1 acyl-CoA thioesterase [Myxococcales bacterium]
MTAEPPMFSHRLRVRYAEVDAQAVVYNAHYLMYYDIALVEYLRAQGLPEPATPPEPGRDFVVKRTSLEFDAPLRLDDLFDVTCRVARLGRSSITFALTIVRAGESTPCNRGEIIWVYTDMQQRRACPIPAHLRALLLGAATTSAPARP